MNSGIQAELDLLGGDGGQCGATANPAANGANGGGDGLGAGVKTYLTDEEILGIGTTTPTAGGRRDSSGDETALGMTDVRDGRRDSSSPLAPRNDNAQEDPADHGKGAGAETRGTEDAAGNLEGAQMPEWMQMLAADPQHRAEAQQLWQERAEYRAAFASPDEAREIKEMFPGGAQDARSLKQAAQAVDQLDAAIYSGDARAQSEVVTELARANPAAFRQLFAEAAKVLAGLGGAQAAIQQESPTLRPRAGEEWGTHEQNQGLKPRYGEQSNVAADGSAALTTRAATHNAGMRRDSSHSVPSGQAPPSAPRNDNVGTVANQQAPQFDAGAYAAFERSTNESVARDLRAAVGDTLSRVLPEGVAEGAERRISEDIFNEIHRTLATDRSLSQQVGEVLRGWKFGAAEQQRVASLLAGRAKQLVPAVARRVIGEWTSSVLVTARSKAARQEAAASRVDIGTPGASRDSMLLRPMSARQIDYARMSDEQILGM